MYRVKLTDIVNMMYSPVNAAAQRESAVCTLQPHLSLLLRSFEEESIDDGNSVGLNVLISPGIGKNSTNNNIKLYK